MCITTIEGLRHYLKDNSGFSLTTINNVVNTRGFSCRGSMARLKDLSTQLENCAEHGADIGIPGFIYYNETIAFYRANRADIVSHMEHTTVEIGTDIVSMVQGFGVFHNQDKPTTAEIGKALWGPIQDEPEFITLYNVFAWYTLEEIARVWFAYLVKIPHTDFRTLPASQAPMFHLPLPFKQSPRRLYAVGAVVLC